MTYRWDYNPGMDTYFLMGPWISSNGVRDPKYKYDRQYAHITSAAGGVYWVCIDPNDMPEKFYNIDEAKAYTIAMVRLT